ncbi:AAA family ATPase [Candidatus Woesearchaeota archaeon]|nr:AAA family ATPase [Candidatus Woesearchaeota archaeon]
MGKIIGIIALKGGVGKTSCTANLGAALAMQYNKKVLIIDTNFNAANLGFHVGLFEPKTTIHDVLLGKAEITDAIYEYQPNLHIIPAAVTPLLIRNPYKLKQKIASLKKHYDVILLDSSPSLNNEILSTMIASDELYVVASPDYPTLSTTLRAVSIAKAKKVPIKGIILNKVRGKKFELSTADVEETAQVPVIGVIPDDVKMLEALAYTKAIHEHAPRTNAAIELNKIAGSIIGENYEDPRLWKRFLEKFKGKNDARGFLTPEGVKRNP